MTARTETSFRLPVPLNALKNIVVFLLKSPTSAFGLAVLLLLVIAAIFAPWLATHDPYAQDLANTLKAPGNGHVFGTDELGRDIYSRLLWGARITLTIISLVSIIVGPVGLLVGTASGYLGGKFDTVMMRITDIFLSFPSLILSLAFVAAHSADTLLRTHVADHSALFGQFDLALGTSSDGQRSLDTWERIKARTETGDPDPELEAAYVQFGRYLMISGSRGSLRMGSVAAIAEIARVKIPRNPGGGSLPGSVGVIRALMSSRSTPPVTTKPSFSGVESDAPTATPVVLRFPVGCAMPGSRPI